MFSYRHAFHAGNHADVLKHTILLAALRHMVQKETPFMALDTHAGAGLYRLDSDYSQLSAEAAEGIVRLAQFKLSNPKTALVPVIQDYLEMVESFNPNGLLRVYPGSPFIIQRLLRDRDKLKLFEIHPTDSKTLTANIGQLDAARQVSILREDGFEGLKKLLPPPTRRAFLLCDPSYELKQDYARVVATISDAMLRFATGVYMVWYPLIARPEAHDLPKRLKTLATKAGKPWLHATLTVKSGKITRNEDGKEVRPGLPASGVFLINPPHLLKSALKDALPQMVEALAQGSNAAFTLESGG